MKRLTGIGGTDIGCIMGCGFKTPYELWELKTGKKQDDYSNDAMRWGTALEDVIRKQYEVETGIEVRTVEPMRNKKVDWWVGSPDGVADDRIIEIKTARFKDEKWGDGPEQIPPGYWMQVQWYMAIVGVDLADVAVLFSGQDFQIYTIQRDDKALKKLYNKAKHFWEHCVMGDTPPDEMTPSERNRFLNIKYAESDGEIKKMENMEQSEQASDFAYQLLSTNQQIKELETRKAELQSKIKECIGSSKGYETDGFRAVWSRSTRQSLDNKMFTKLIEGELGKEKTEELLEKCKKTASYPRLTVTEKKAK